MGELVSRILSARYRIIKITSSLPKQNSETYYWDYSSPLENIIDHDIVQNTRYIFNLHGPSSVGASFAEPMKYLDRPKTLFHIYDFVKKSNPEIKIYSAASSEVFGNVPEGGAYLNANYDLRSPYSIGVANSVNISKFYKNNYGLKIVNGFTFNHESILRSDQFFLQSLLTQAKKVSRHQEQKIILGNLKPIRDFGYAPEYAAFICDYMEADQSRDFILGTGVRISLTEMVDIVLKRFDLNWDCVEQRASKLRSSDIDISYANSNAVFECFAKNPRIHTDALIDKLLHDSENKINIKYVNQNYLS